MNLKLLRIIASVDPKGGGPIQGILSQSQIQTRLGIETHIASLDDPAAPLVQSCPLPVHALGKEGPAGWRRHLPWRHVGYSSAFVPWLRLHIGDYDVVMVHGLWNYATMGASRALAGQPVPWVVFTHGMLDPWFRRTYPLKHLAKQFSWLISEGPLLNNARAVLFTTEEERVRARNMFFPYRIKERVVSYGVGDLTGDPAAQVAAFRAGLPGLGDRPFLLFLSRIHRKKGCDLLIDAFARIAAAHPGLDLVIAGPDQTGMRKGLEARAAALGVAQRIHWPGMLTGERKSGAFRGAEAFVLPSHQENFGIAVAEAMAAGAPVLISDKVNIWREVEQSGGGLVEPDDAAGAHRLLERFLALSPARRAEMRRCARAGFLRYFAIEQAVATVNHVLQEVTDDRAAQR